jgi:hypothetical protein
MPNDLAATQDPLVYRPLAQALRRLGPGRNGRPPHIATGIRWGTDGVPLSDGSRLYLKVRRLPGRWVTTDEWVDEFIDALTRDRVGQDAAPAVRPSTARRKAIESADREAEALVG